MDEIARAVEALKNHAIDVRIEGRFLLSTADIEDSWIDINEFLTTETFESMEITLSWFIEEYYRRHGPFTLLTPNFIDSSEKSFPVHYIADNALRKCRTKVDDNVKHFSVFRDAGKGNLNLTGKPAGRCVLAVGMSVHIGMILKIIEFLLGSDITIDSLFTFVCRELTSVKMLTNMNIGVFPVIIQSEETREIFSFLDRREFENEGIWKLINDNLMGEGNGNE